MENKQMATVVTLDRFDLEAMAEGKAIRKMNGSGPKWIAGTRMVKNRTKSRRGEGIISARINKRFIAKPIKKSIKVEIKKAK